MALGRAEGDDALLKGTVEDVGFLGSVVRVGVDVGGQAVALDLFNTAAVRPPEPGQPVEISFATADALLAAEPS